MLGPGYALLTNNTAVLDFVALVQTNEVSTIFLYPYLEGGKTVIMSRIFGVVFILSRIVWNMLYTVPLMWNDVVGGKIDKVWFGFISLYQLLQFFWLYGIIRMATRKKRRN